MLNIVLLEPEIPANTGNIGRTCLLTNTKLHLIRPFNFHMDDKILRRTGLDYWKDVNIEVYDNYEDFINKNKNANIYYATTKSQNIYSDVKFKEDDFILFGKESAGIPENILNENKSHTIRVPMIKNLKRSFYILASKLNYIRKYKKYYDK